MKFEEQSQDWVAPPSAPKMKPKSNPQQKQQAHGMCLVLVDHHLDQGFFIWTLVMLTLYFVIQLFLYYGFKTLY